MLFNLTPSVYFFVTASRSGMPLLVKRQYLGQTFCGYPGGIKEEDESTLDFAVRIILRVANAWDFYLPTRLNDPVQINPIDGTPLKWGPNQTQVEFVFMKLPGIIVGEAKGDGMLWDTAHPPESIRPDVTWQVFSRIPRMPPLVATTTVVAA